MKKVKMKLTTRGPEPWGGERVATILLLALVFGRIDVASVRDACQNQRVEPSAQTGSNSSIGGGPVVPFRRESAVDS